MLRQVGLIIRCKSTDNVHVINHKLKKKCQNYSASTAFLSCLRFDKEVQPEFGFTLFTHIKLGYLRLLIVLPVSAWNHRHRDVMYHCPGVRGERGLIDVVHSLL